MDLKIIEFNNVQRDLDAGFPTSFNTNFHKEHEAPDLTIPSHSPYSYDRWLPVILKSRGIPDTAVQVISLTRAQVRVLVLAAGASVHSRVLNRAYAEDLEEEVHPAFDKLVFPLEGLFVRLGACSPKDGAHTVAGRMSLHSIEDIILRLTTSGRASGTFSNMLMSDDSELPLFFLPFDSRMNAEREYRVFCAPESLRITAVSQYRWHKPWILANGSLEEMETTAGKILDGIKGLHGKIVGDLSDEADGTDALLRSQGFSFDVLYDEDQERCELIELNTFGVRSACGSCLFQWVKDRELLYGQETQRVEFRVAV